MGKLFELIFGAFQDTIEEKLEKEIDKQVESRLTKYIEHVSQTYDVSLKLLLRDFQRLDELDHPKSKPGICMGIKANGSRCTCKAVIRGYCRRHQTQIPVKPVGNKQSEIEMKDFVKHTHSIPPMYDPNCPACKKNTTEKEKVLIEL
jgi:hypothetical protein